MLRMNATQVSELSQQALDKAKENFREHLIGFAPERSRAAGDDGLKRYIDAGVSAALTRGLWQRGPMRLWLETGVILGASFAADPQYARLIPEIDPREFPMPFAERLHRGVSDYLATCFGPARSTLQRVLRDLADVDIDASMGRADKFIAELARIWPEKLEWTREAPLNELFRHAEANAVRLGLDTPDGRALCAVLSVSFGADFADDPLCPWLHARLDAEATARARVAGVKGALKTYYKAAARAAVTHRG